MLLPHARDGRGARRGCDYGQGTDHQSWVATHTPANRPGGGLYGGCGAFSSLYEHTIYERSLLHSVMLGFSLSHLLYFSRCRPAAEQPSSMQPQTGIYEGGAERHFRCHTNLQIAKDRVSDKEERRRFRQKSSGCMCYYYEVFL